MARAHSSGRRVWIGIENDDDAFGANDGTLTARFDALERELTRVLARSPLREATPANAGLLER